MEASGGAATADTHVLFIKAFRFKSNCRGSKISAISKYGNKHLISWQLVEGNRNIRAGWPPKLRVLALFLTVFRQSLLFVELEPEELGPWEEFRYYQDVIISLNTPASLHLCQFSSGFHLKNSQTGLAGPCGVTQVGVWPTGFLSGWIPGRRWCVNVYLLRPCPDVLSVKRFDVGLTFTKVPSPPSKSGSKRRQESKLHQSVPAANYPPQTASHGALSESRLLTAQHSGSPHAVDIRCPTTWLQQLLWRSNNIKVNVRKTSLSETFLKECHDAGALLLVRLRTFVCPLIMSWFWFAVMRQ